MIIIIISTVIGQIGQIDCFVRNECLGCRPPIGIPLDINVQSTCADKINKYVNMTQEITDM
jgi:hypothetical protein